MRVIDLENTPDEKPPALNRKLVFEFVLYCKNRACSLAKDKVKKGENLVDIKTK